MSGWAIFYSFIAYYKAEIVEDIINKGIFTYQNEIAQNKKVAISFSFK